MDPKLQTSFIPKKPIVPVGGAAVPQQRHHGTSLFMTIGVFVFLASLVAAGGAYAWKGILTSSQETYKKELADREQRFNVDLIEELKRANVRIDLTSRLLADHLAISQIFDIVSRLTISKVRFTSLTISNGGPTGDGGLNIDMKGYGTSLSAVAFQSDVLGQLEQYGLRKVVKNPILSDPSLDTAGTVSFGFSATIDPSTIRYTTSVRGESEITPATTPTNP